MSIIAIDKTTDLLMGLFDKDTIRFYEKNEDNSLTYVGYVVFQSNENGESQKEFIFFEGFEHYKESYGV